MTDNFNFKRALGIAYLWNMLGKFVVRGLGIISTLIIVRLLEPEDFGLVAIAMLIIGLGNVLANIGVYRYLILKPDICDNDLNTAWTINIILRSIIVAGLLLLAPILANLWGDQDITLVIRLLALVELISMFKNVGMITFEKAVSFKQSAKLGVIAKFGSFTVTVISAFMLRNYMALVLGAITNAAFSTLFSYYISKYRPKFSLKIDRAMFSVSNHLFLRNILGYARSQMDLLIVGQFFGSSAAGKFNIARTFAIMPQTDIISPAMQPFFSASSKQSRDYSLVEMKFYQMLFLSFSLAFPAIIGLYILSEPFTLVVLGEKWIDVTPFIGMLGFLMLPFITQPLLFNLYDFKGKSGIGILNDLFGIFAIISAVMWLQPVDLTTFVETRIFVAFLSLLFMVWLARMLIHLSWLNVLLIVLVVSIPTFTMFAALKALMPVFLNINPTVVLLSVGIIGLVIYVLMFLLIASLCKRIKSHFLHFLYPDLIYKYTY
ncbi:oligosaccharide flippase family protein [Alteromonas gilva]|uniref:Oligosaccharide flippase family protein n=1 Tax=Alteromonas gilva TaxID=2987522 RepID=A0ABT5L1I5_9ALTE|nr:oligosaccharide flippase family protein [Alteromonas gilva]MDC8830336.1 oligosaccharide flippase family protein [Alteromonas gilva]